MERFKAFLSFKEAEAPPKRTANARIVPWQDTGLGLSAAAKLRLQTFGV